MCLTSSALYTRDSGTVNAVNASLLAATSADVETIPLLFNLALDAAGIADFVSAKVRRMARAVKMPVPKGFTDVFAALCSFLKAHSNTVWPSEEELSRLSGWSERTVRRCMAILRFFGVIKKVSGDDLHGGPGPHNFPRDERRNTKYTVPTYELGPTWFLLPDPIRNWLKASASPVPAQQELPNPFEESESGHAPSVTATPQASPVSSGQSHDAEGDRSTSAALCNVKTSNDVAESEDPFRDVKGAAPQPVKAKKAGKRSAATLPEIQRPKLAYGKGIGYAALFKLGWYPELIRRCIREHEPNGDLWAYKLARYAEWAPGVPDDKHGGYAMKVWQKFEPFSPEFERWFARECEAVDRKLRSQTPTRKAPSEKAPEKVQEPASVPRTGFDHAPADVRASLIARALAELKAELDPLLFGILERATRNGKPGGKVLERAALLFNSTG